MIDNKSKNATDHINDINIPELCWEMFIAVNQKYMYDCYQEGVVVLTPEDWLQHQIFIGNWEILGDVVEGMNPTVIEEIIKNNFPSSFKGQRGAYDSFTEEDKEQTKNKIVTYDQVFIAKLRIWDWLFNTNFLLRSLGSNSFIEINLICDVNLSTKLKTIQQLMIKIQTKAMSKKGKGEIAELRFNINNGKADQYANVEFEEIIFMHMPLGSYTEKKMEYSDKENLIKFMQKFIKNQEEEMKRMSK